MTLPRLIGLALAGVLLYAAWLLLHPAQDAKLVSAAQPRVVWNLPQRPELDAAGDVKQIKDNRLWGAGFAFPGAGLAPEPPLTPPNWRVTGVISAAGDTYAIVATEAVKTGLLLPGMPAPKYSISQLRVGDKLPGGASILHIQPDRLGILLNGKKRILRVYQE